MKYRLDVLVTAILLACALVTTGLVMRREFFVSHNISAERPAQKTVFIEDWRTHIAKGALIGEADAQVQLIEFADFECPFCAKFHEAFKTLQGRYPSQVALSFVHYPLPMHRFAEPAARAAECAGAQGRFEAMHDLLFERQREFGLRPWSEFATEVGVFDSSAFEACIKSTEPVPRVSDGKALGSAFDIKGTPTIVINGWQLARPPSIEELDGMVKAVLAGKSPIATDAKARR